MQSLAKLINKKYGHSICDLAVYKDKDQSLRLPTQYKINDADGRKSMSSTTLDIITHSKFSDFIV